MVKYLFSFIIFTTIVLIACDSDGFNISDARKAILEQNIKRITALKEGNIDTLVELYSDDATLLPPNDSIMRGKETIGMYYLLAPRSGKILDASLASTEITGNETVLYEIGEYNFTIKTFESDATHTDIYKYLTVWKYQNDGSWKIYAECWNAEPPNTIHPNDPAID